MRKYFSDYLKALSDSSVHVFTPSISPSFSNSIYDEARDNFYCRWLNAGSCDGVDFYRIVLDTEMMNSTDPLIASQVGEVGRTIISNNHSKASPKTYVTQSDVDNMLDDAVITSSSEYNAHLVKSSLAAMVQDASNSLDNKD